MEFTRLLRDFINIQHWLDNDPVTDWQARLQRDREIHLSIEANSLQSPATQILGWWKQIAADHDIENVGEDVVRILSWTSILTAFIGLVLGASAALAVLHYDGSEPINILVAVSVLVIAPMVLLITSLCLPLVNPDGLLSRLNLGAMLQSVIRTRFSHLGPSFSFPLDGLKKYLAWRFMGYSQLFGVAFALAALAVLLLKVTLTDLAFAWGTTLSIEPDIILQIVRVISSPWSPWLPAATPDQHLVAVSQFYRLGDGVNNASATALTGWWRFLAASLMFYGVLVRALLFVFARLKAEGSLEKLFLSHPQSIALLERLNSEAITFNVPTISEESGPSDTILGVSRQSSDAITCVFSWHGAPITPESSAGSIFIINGQADLNAQKAEIEIQSENARAVLIVCKGWEPPLLEFHDFLYALRELLGVGPAIIISPVDENGVGSPDDDRNVWRESVAKINDANVYIQ